MKPRILKCMTAMAPFAAAKGMKSRLRQCADVFALFAVLIIPFSLAAQTYSVVKLDGLGGGAGANSINDRGWVAGQANKAGDNVSHAALWVGGSEPIDLGTLGGPETNSAVSWPVKANNGLIVGISDTNEDNPLGEAFSCWPFFAPAAPSRKICKGFRWENGKMSPLPPFPGGYNSYATAANNRGQVVGWAENGVHDSTCDTSAQVLQFKAAIWGPKGEMQELPPLPGDHTSAATAINDRGQVVGISGACGVAVGDVSAAHAVLWENGVPTNIGDLGGHTWNTPTAINNDGVVVGFSLPADKDGTRFYRAFVWTKEAGIKMLDQIEGDVRSAALGINEDGQIVGFSRTAAAVRRAVIWENANAKIKNLNDLVPPGSPYLLIAGDINNSGRIAGYTGDGFAFLAIPSDSATQANSSDLPISRHERVKVGMAEKIRPRLFERWGLDLNGDE
jgi:probable HAF family extracellular repeat protein